mmetsp:Transcript_9914/g.18890  ORF Transcript_9914/g.18890 Transcript_9914/m.18890 type:complete len:84 (+) Transcript_9914:927-1178(+)
MSRLAHINITNLLVILPSSIVFNAITIFTIFFISKLCTFFICATIVVSRALFPCSDTASNGSICRSKISPLFFVVVWYLSTQG